MHTRLLLVVEPDPLTVWSLTTYLQRWFTVETCTAAQDAQTFLSHRRVDGLVLTGGLPPGALKTIAELASAGNPDVRVVLLVTGEGEPATIPGATRIEKPFGLDSLAHHLGVSPSEPMKTTGEPSEPG